MYEVIMALVVLIAGVIVGSMLKPTEDQKRPLYPDDIQSHSTDSGHHGHH
jgi:hypothetical protein